MELFNPDAPWTQAAGKVQVFKLAGEWVGTDPWNVHASDSELRQVVADLNRRGIALAMEAGPLEPTATCGQGIEGFGGGEAIGIRDARRIKNAGGTLSYIALDEPFFFASIYDGENACRWTAENVAKEVGTFIEGVRTVFPDILVGDIEPYVQGVDVEDYTNWLSTFRSVNGYDLAFFHLDVDFSQPDWSQAALELETFANESNIDFGIIYFGSWNAKTDEEWLVSAGERVKTYELVTGGKPDHILFQSWHDHPDYTLPETEPYTFTWFINTYFEDKTALGVRTEGPGANLAYGKPVTTSGSYQAQPPGSVDGNMDTYWGAGDFAPQWIEIDLETPMTIGKIRLVTSQSPEGNTRHQIWVGSSIDSLELLYTFEGFTNDLQLLEFIPEAPLTNVQYIRVVTRESPSWVGWREIEVLAP